MTYSIVIGFDKLEEMYSRIFIFIVHIYKLVTTCICLPLLTFWSHPEQSWMFALIVPVLKITYSILQLYLLR